MFLTASATLELATEYKQKQTKIFTSKSTTTTTFHPSISHQQQRRGIPNTMGVAALSPINDKLLHGAKVGNLIDVTTCLADSKVNLECTDENKYTPLFWACMNGHAVVVDLLLEKKASTTCQNLNKQGPLHMAATKGYIDIVESLLENGADPNALSVFGRVPLHNAVINGHSKLAKLMVDKGVDIYAADDDGKTAIHMGKIPSLSLSLRPRITNTIIYYSLSYSHSPLHFLRPRITLYSLIHYSLTISIHPTP